MNEHDLNTLREMDKWMNKLSVSMAKLGLRSTQVQVIGKWRELRRVIENVEAAQAETVPPDAPEPAKKPRRSDAVRRFMGEE